MNSVRRVLRLPEVMKITGVGRSSLYKWISEGSFPRSFLLGSRAVGWFEGDVQIWLDSRVQSRRTLDKSEGAAQSRQF